MMEQESATCAESMQPFGRKGHLDTSPKSRLRRGLGAPLAICGAFALLDCILFERGLDSGASWLQLGKGTAFIDLLLCSVLGALALNYLLRSPADHIAAPAKADTSGKGSTLQEGDLQVSGAARIEDCFGAAARLPPPLVRLNQALELAVRQGNADKAAKTIQKYEATGRQPEPMSYNIVMHAYAKRGDVKAAEYWMTRMQSKGVQITACSCNTLLDACARADDVKGCEEWLQHMLRSGIEPNVISYATVIYAHARQGNKGAAESWFQCMIKAGVQPDAMCYNSMIHACSVCGHTSRAEMWIQEMQASGLSPTVTTFTAVIDACAKAGDVPKAEKWLDTMLQEGVEANVVTYSAVIDACAKAGNLKRAEYWLAEMSQRGIRPNAHSYTAVINACAKCGNVDAAEHWLDRSEEAGAMNDVVVYSSVIDACGKANQPDRAMAAFCRMRIKGIRPHVVAYSALARPFAYQGKWAEVEQIAEDMKRDGVSPNEYFIYAKLLAYAMSRPRQGRKAEQCFREAVAAGIKPNDHITSALSRAVGRARSMELAQEVLGAEAAHAINRRSAAGPAPSQPPAKATAK